MLTQRLIKWLDRHVRVEKVDSYGIGVIVSSEGAFIAAVNRAVVIYWKVIV